MEERAARITPGSRKSTTPRRDTGSRGRLSRPVGYAQRQMRSELRQPAPFLVQGSGPTSARGSRTHRSSPSGQMVFTIRVGWSAVTGRAAGGNCAATSHRTCPDQGVHADAPAAAHSDVLASRFCYYPARAPAAARIGTSGRAPPRINSATSPNLLGDPVHRAAGTSQSVISPRHVDRAQRRRYARLFGLKEIGQCRSRTGCSGGHGVRLRGCRRFSAALRLLAAAGIAGRGG